MTSLLKEVIQAYFLKILILQILTLSIPLLLLGFEVFRIRIVVLLSFDYGLKLTISARSILLRLILNSS